jgi:hypothetical protein
MKTVSSNLVELTDFIGSSLDVDDAIKFDGGGSSKLWFNGKVLEPGDSRKLTNFLVVLSQAGTGINLSDMNTVPSDEQTPAIPPGNKIGKSWSDQILVWWHSTEVYKKWQELSQDIAEIQQAINDLKEIWTNIQDLNWWNEQCSGAVTIPLSLAILVYVRRKPKRGKIDLKSSSSRRTRRPQGSPWSCLRPH